VARRWPVRGALATCKGNAGRGGLGGVLAGCCLGIGALWIGVGETTPVGNLQRAEGEREGVRACSSSSPPCLMAWVGAGEAGARPRGLHEHGYRVRANGNNVGHSRIDFPGFLPTRCSTQCPQEFKFRIFEKFHFGLSTYYTRIPEIFLLSKKMRFCKNLNSKLRFGH
jgi:hypothetical protein